VLTAYGEISDAVAAMKQGASDYLKKPIDLEELALATDKVLGQSALRHRLVYSQQRDSHAIEGATLLGDSDAIRQVRTQIQRLASLDAPSGEPLPTVLIRGETGTGKDVAARMLHAMGSRAARPFVQVDCATLPRDLMEAELFGHDKGAYTGAHGARAGLIEAAEDGAVFLDEVGEVPLDLQAKLLTVIERRRTRRIGSLREQTVAARFIAATNRNLEQMIARGEFRSDLYYRLNVISLPLPPLRACSDDARLLAQHFVQTTCRRYGLPPRRMTAGALDAICAYNWPGNVRELKHLVERAVLLSQGEELSEATLGLPSKPPQDHPHSLAGLTLDAAERMLIDQALTASGSNVSEAARRLGVSRMTLRYRMEKHGLKGE
jgi:DNA-binding NtrC family response regulator